MSATCEVVANKPNWDCCRLYCVIRDESMREVRPVDENFVLGGWGYGYLVLNKTAAKLVS